jgi:Ca2+:H+ antiporter
VQYLAFTLCTHTDLLEEERKEEDEPTLSAGGATAILALSTVLVALNSEALVGSIEGLTEEANLGQHFVGTRAFTTDGLS